MYGSQYTLLIYYNYTNYFYTLDKLSDNRKRRRCGECQQCSAEDCGICRFCIDKKNLEDQTSSSSAASKGDVK